MDYQTLSPKERIGGSHAHIAVDDHYGRWMVRLSSFGLKEFAAPDARSSRELSAESGSPLRRACAVKQSSLRGRSPGHAEKNRIMASTANHAAGDDVRVSRLVNLLLSEVPGVSGVRDGTHRRRTVPGSSALRDAVRTASGGRCRNDSVGARPACENSCDQNSSRAQDSSYLSLFEKLAASNVDPRLKRHAEAAIERIQRGTLRRTRLPSQAPRMRPFNQVARKAQLLIDFLRHLFRQPMTAGKSLAADIAPARLAPRPAEDIRPEAAMPPPSRPTARAAGQP